MFSRDHIKPIPWYLGCIRGQDHKMTSPLNGDTDLSQGYFATEWTWNKIRSVLLKSTMLWPVWELKPESCNHECNILKTKQHAFTITSCILTGKVSEFENGIPNTNFLGKKLYLAYHNPFIWTELLIHSYFSPLNTLPRVNGEII